MDNVKVFAPATVANLSVGYDLLGLSLSKIGDTIEIRKNTLSTNRIIHLNDKNLPLDIKHNCCSVVIDYMQSSMGVNFCVDISIDKGFKSGSGLGSSSASSAAAAFAFNTMIGSPFSLNDLVYFAMQGEKIACGTAHADNVAPALMGGITFIHNNNPIEIINLPVPDNLYVIVIYQNITLKTAESRLLVPNEIETKKAINQCSMIGSFIHALHCSDYELMKKSMVDFIAEPKRKKLIPNYERLLNIALEYNSINFGIAGSGPSVYAIIQNENDAQELVNAYSKFFNHSDEVLIHLEKLTNTSNCKIL